MASRPPPFIFTEWITDYSKCIVIDFGDRDEEHCPPSADTEVVIFKGHLVSPLVYSERVCIEDYEEEPIFDEDGMGKSLCTKWKTRTFRHPLQYTIYHRPGTFSHSDYWVDEVIMFVPHCD